MNEELIKELKLEIEARGNELYDLHKEMEESIEEYDFIMDEKPAAYCEGEIAGIWFVLHKLESQEK